MTISVNPVHLVSVIRRVSGQEDNYFERGTAPAEAFFRFTFPSRAMLPLVEATDEELTGLVEQSGAFTFLADPDEVIYTLEDGTSV